MPTFQSWQDIKTLRFLEISSSSGNTEERNIFSNGLNNVDVIIHFQAENENGEIITDVPATQVLEHSALITYESGVPIYRGYRNDTGAQNAWFYNTYSDEWTLEPPPNVLQKAQAVAVEDPIIYPRCDLKKNDNVEHSGIPYLASTEGLPSESDALNGVEIAYSDEEYNAQRAQINSPLQYDHTVDFTSPSPQSQFPPAYEQFPGADGQEGNRPENERIYKEDNHNNPVIADNEWANGSFYVRRNGSVYGSLQIAVRVFLTHPYRTVEYISTDRHSASGIRNYVTVRSHLAIDYTDKKNVIIPNAESIVSVITSYSLGWTSRFSKLGPYYTHNNGTAEYAYVDLTPRIGGYFKYATASKRYYLSDFDVSGYQYAAWGETTENVFSGILNISYEKPMAVMSKGGIVNLFYFANSSNDSFSFLAFNGVIFFQSTNYTYRFAPSISLSYNSLPGSNPAKLIRVRFTMNEWGVWNYNWNNADGSPVTMFLQDIYGNYGDFQFGFNSDTYFDVPGAI